MRGSFWWREKATSGPAVFACGPAEPHPGLSLLGIPDLYDMQKQQFSPTLIRHKTSSAQSQLIQRFQRNHPRSTNHNHQKSSQNTPESRHGPTRILCSPNRDAIIFASRRSNRHLRPRDTVPLRRLQSESPVEERRPDPM